MRLNAVRVKVYGDFACWTRPENKVERVSYECMTPSAARNILDAICWKPEMRWVVTAVTVLRPILFQALRRNEVQSKISPGSVKKWMANPESFAPMVAGAGSEEVTQRSTLALRKPAYIIEAYPHVYEGGGENTPTKYVSMLNRRVEKGQCFHRPALGCREFAAQFEPPGPEDQAQPVNVPLGMMLYDVIFRAEGNRAVFFRAELKNGVLDTDPERVIADETLRKEVMACSYRR
ncbi:MAG: type I-C CRISPR-associated protein Cas5c [Bryobacteraceae bacterium]